MIINQEKVRKNTLEKGHKLVKDKKIWINDKEFLGDSIKFEGQVYDKRFFEVELIIENEEVIDASCTCSKKSICEHIVALYFAKEREDMFYEEVDAYDDEPLLNEEDFDFLHWNSESEKVTYEPTEIFPSYRESLEERGKKFLDILKSYDTYIDQKVDRVEVELIEDESYRHLFTIHFYLIYENEKISIININKFINGWYYKQKYMVRTKEIYNPKRNKFDKQTSNFFNFLFDFLEDNEIKGTIGAYWEEMADLLEIIDSFGIKIYTTEGYYNKKNKFKINFEIRDKGESVELLSDDLSEIRLKNQFLYLRQTLYYLPVEERALIMELINFFSEDNRIKFEKKHMNLISPLLEKYSKNINYISGNTKLLGLEDVELAFYFDKNPQNDVVCNIKTTYKNKEVDIFSDEVEVLGKEKALKDIEKYLLFCGFKGDRGSYILNEEKLIYEFLRNQLDFLKKRGGVYFSENFDAMTSKFNFVIKSNLTLGDKNSIDIRFDLEGVEELNIEDVYELRKKREKYIRLKNGSFVDLRGENLEKFEKIVGDLDLDNIMNINLPHNSILYVNSKLNKLGMGSIEKSKELKRYLASFEEKEEFELGEYYENLLRSYQKDGVEWFSKLSKYNLGGVLADDMGLGKTLQVLAYLNSLDLRGRSIIVVPKSLIYNWVREIEKFAPNLKALVIEGTKADRRYYTRHIDEYDIIITSYSLLRQDIELYEDEDFEYIFIDEAQHIKNPRAQVSKAVKRLKGQKRFALTGTPIENRLDELWSIFDFVMPTYLSSLGRFQEKYSDLKRENLEDLKYKIEYFVLRRTKKEVLKDLPEKLETEVYVNLNSREKAIYRAFVKGFMQEYDEKTEKLEVLTILLKLRQICCHSSLVTDKYRGHSSKEEALLELVEDALDGGHRILIFSQFTSMLKILEKSLNKHKVKTFYLDGQTPSKNRIDLVDRFNGGEGEVFLISLKAGGTGLNLVGADMVIHYDPWWNPAVENQASDRIYRIGQEKKVQIIKMITKGTIEEKIFDIQKNKQELSDSILNVNNKNKVLEGDLLDLLKL